MALQFSTDNIEIEDYEIFIALTSAIKDGTIDITNETIWQLNADSDGNPATHICRTGAIETGVSLGRTQDQTVKISGGQTMTLSKMIDFSGTDLNVTKEQLAGYDALINKDVTVFMVPKEAIDEDDGAGSFLTDTQISYAHNLSIFPDVNITAGEKRGIALKASRSTSVKNTGISLGNVN